MSLSLLYVRVSSKHQEREGFSLDAQEKLGYDYARRKNLEIVRCWKVSESAWKSERAAFNQMVEYAKRHSEIEHVIFDVTDRMTRNDLDKLKVYSLIKKHGKTVHFARTGKVFSRSSGSDDEFMLDIEVAVAKKMSSDISRRVRMGMQEKAERGLYPSVCPLGYRNNPTTHLIEVDEEKAPYVRRAFSLVATGSYSLGMVTDMLYEEGFRSKKGYRVSKGVLHSVLRNPLFCGDFRWKGRIYTGDHTAIVSREMFDKVQSVLDGKSHPRQGRRGFVFNNLIHCGICGCKVSGERKKDRYNYYHCTFSRGRHRGVSYIREESLASMFEGPIKRVTIEPDIADWLSEAFREHNRDIVEVEEKRLSSLRAQCERAERRLSRLYDARFDDDIDEEVFLTKEKEYRRQVAEARARISTRQTVNRDFCREADFIFELSKRLHSLYLSATHQDKARILKLVASNYLLMGGSLCPTYRKPFDILAEGASRSIWHARQDSNLRPTD